MSEPEEKTLTGFDMKVQVDLNDPAVNEILADRESDGILECRVDASDVVEGLNNNDGSIFAFIMDVLDLAGSSELEQDLLEELEDRLNATNEDPINAGPTHNDFDDESPTPTVDVESMRELMETLRSPGVPTLTSERPTKPMRPIAVDRDRG